MTASDTSFGEPPRLQGIHPIELEARGARYNRVNWPKLCHEAKREEDWLHYPLLPAGRGVALYSPAKMGKSLLGLEISAAVATGRPVLGYAPSRPRCVVYLDYENSAEGDILPRLKAMGYSALLEQDNPFFNYCSLPQVGNLDAVAGAMDMNLLIELYKPELVVIDTVSRTIGGEENSNDTWNRFHQYTGMTLKRANVAMLRLDHSGLNISKGQRGASAKSGDVDAVWRLAHIKEDSFQLICEASRLQMPEKTLRFERLEEPYLHHSLQVDGNATIRIREILALLQSGGLNPATATRNSAMKVLRDAGKGVRNETLSKALRQWKDSVN